MRELPNAREILLTMCCDLVEGWLDSKEELSGRV